MDVIGVVGEFDPFHLGHLAHFQASRDALGGDAAIVCVMSGDFVQRGGPAAFNKHARAEMALAAGADLVFELPLPWCMASAERFALGAVGLLDGLGAVTHLSFGSEAGALDDLAALADAAARPETIEAVKERMEAGEPFAAAREAVLRRLLGPAAEMLEKPNNILAVEYLKALAGLGSPIRPMTTHRRESRHDGTGDGPVRSAGQLRAMLAAGEDVTPFVPAGAAAIVEGETAAGRGPVTAGALEGPLLSRLRALSREDFQALPDATEGLGNRLWQASREAGTLQGVLEAVKTRRYPLSRLRRMVFAAGLGLRAGMGEGTPPYARLLAFSQRGRALLRLAGERGRVPVLTKPAAVRDLPDPAGAVFALTAAARDFYVLGYGKAEERRGLSDWKAGPAS